jgi:hypothetical protein
MEVPMKCERKDFVQDCVKHRHGFEKQIEQTIIGLTMHEDFVQTERQDKPSLRNMDTTTSNREKEE